MALMKSKMSSMFCWHTYGTVMKQKKNFQEAAKCFQMALNFEKDNMQLLRETASLQVQVRDHNNHLATRLKILQLKPNLIHNWVGFAVAHHLVLRHWFRKVIFNNFTRHWPLLKTWDIQHKWSQSKFLTTLFTESSPLLMEAGINKHSNNSIKIKIKFWMKTYGMSSIIKTVSNWKKKKKQLPLWNF